MPNQMRAFGLAAIALVAGLAGPARAADTYPQRDVTFIVPFAPGGGTDPIGRQFAASLEKALKGNVDVENKPGGSATVGISTVLRAHPDGYTIGLGTNAALVYQPLVNEGLIYKSPDDYEPIVKLVELPSIIVVKGDSKWKNLDEFLADAKASPGKMRASVSGLGTIVEMVLQQLNKAAGVKITPVPFTGGGGEGLVAVLGGRVEANVTSGAAGVAGQVAAGEVRVLAVAQKGKYEPFPDATPMGDKYGVTLPYATYVIAPKGLPADVKAKLVAASLEAVKSDEFRSFAKTTGMIVDPKGPDETRQELVDYTATFKDLKAFMERK